MGLKEAIANVTKEYGDGAIFRLDDAALDVEVIPTGIATVDEALGAGGLPRGRVIEVFGQESSAKTTLALYLIANAQRQGGQCVFIDAEHALDPDYARRVGVDADSLYIAQPDNGEQALEIAMAMVEAGDVDVVVIDSVAALVPEAELRGDIGDAHVGRQARMMSQALRILTPKLISSNTVVVFINQIREKVGVMFGNPEVTPGGRALKFFSSVRIETRKGKPIKDGEDILGTEIKVKIVKNKVGPPFVKASFDLDYGTGINVEAAELDVALSKGLVVQKGSWYADAETGEKLGQGRASAAEKYSASKRE